MRGRAAPHLPTQGYIEYPPGGYHGGKPIESVVYCLNVLYIFAIFSSSNKKAVSVSFTVPFP